MNNSAKATRATRTIARLSAALLVLFAATVWAQQPRFLSLTPPEGLPVIPVLEGWVALEDGSRGFSYGVINRNDVPVEIPQGEKNYLEPARYNGFQPTHFPPGRGTGIFYIVVSPEDADIDVWWYLQTGDSEVLKVPGRASQSAYELDFIRPRPQGGLQPWVSFGDTDDLSPGLLASIKDYPGRVATGEEISLTVTARDPSERDPTDPRFEEPLDMGVEFNKYQGPGEVTFSRDPNAPEPENPYEEDDPRFSRWTPPEANEATIEGGAGSVVVNVSFSAPGEYLIHAKINNFTAPDSSNGDQCCWTNVYQRVQVTR
ncbi:MAG: hypothetical protein ACR2PR_05175 [Pseudohongiellaceae bacterium]